MDDSLRVYFPSTKQLDPAIYRVFKQNNWKKQFHPTTWLPFLWNVHQAKYHVPKRKHMITYKNCIMFSNSSGISDDFGIIVPPRFFLPPSKSRSPWQNSFRSMELLPSLVCNVNWKHDIRRVSTEKSKKHQHKPTQSKFSMNQHTNIKFVLKAYIKHLVCSHVFSDISNWK